MCSLLLSADLCTACSRADISVVHTLYSGVYTYYTTDLYPVVAGRRPGRGWDLLWDLLSCLSIMKRLQAYQSVGEAVHAYLPARCDESHQQIATPVNTSTTKYEADPLSCGGIHEVLPVYRPTIWSPVLREPRRLSLEQECFCLTVAMVWQR